MHKVSIRSEVFERNSSSSHSVSYRSDEVIDLSELRGQLRSGEIEIRIPEEGYGWEWRRLYRPENKLAYLLVQACGGFCPSLPDEARPGDDVTDTFRDAGWRAENLIRSVEEFTGCAVRVVAGEDRWPSGVDHQSVGAADDILGEDDATVARFVFGSDAYVETGNDNSSPPEKITTDRGPDDYYYASVQVGSVPPFETFSLIEEPASEHGSWVVSVVSGEEIYEPPVEMGWVHRQEIHDLLKEDGVVVYAFAVSMPFPAGMRPSEKNALARQTAFERFQDVVAESRGMKLLRDFEVVMTEDTPDCPLPSVYHARRAARVTLRAVAPSDVIESLAAVIRRVADEPEGRPAP